MTSPLEEIFSQVLKRVNPNESEQKKVQELAKELTKKVEEAARKRGVDAKVRVEGSVAKNTWLRDCPEIDVFMQVSTTTPKEAFRTILLEIAKKATEGYTQIERFAEHPYLETIIGEVYVNIVPCYKVKQGKWISATDRTPFHTDYIKSLLDSKMSREVRLLKRFMKGIGVYGAEIKVGGFSGYLCELLVLSYGSFTEVLRSAADWKERTIIDYQKHYKRTENTEKLFEEPLIMVDPVDKTRNVAAAVRKERYDEFTAASRAFLKAPEMKFFYPPETEALEPPKLVKKIKARGSTLVFLSFTGEVIVPDVLWGKLYRNQRSLRNLIKQHDFKVLSDSVWSNEKGLNVFIFEIENRFLPNMKLHIGPPLGKKQECEKFLKKHLGANSTVSGPRVEDRRWIIDVKRRYTDVVKLLKEKWENSISDYVSQTGVNSFKVGMNNEILKLYSDSPEFAKFLTEYLEGKPKWLVGV